jgi:hypothetical protein
MRDNKPKTPAHGNRSTSDPDREVRALMRKTGTSYSQVLALLHRYGHDRASIERAAARLRTT